LEGAQKKRGHIGGCIEDTEEGTLKKEGSLEGSLEGAEEGAEEGARHEHDTRHMKTGPINASVDRSNKI
jgi:hypothetical protein